MGEGAIEKIQTGLTDAAEEQIRELLGPYMNPSAQGTRDAVAAWLLEKAGLNPEQAELLVQSLDADKIQALAKKIGELPDEEVNAIVARLEQDPELKAYEEKDPNFNLRKSLKAWRGIIELSKDNVSLIIDLVSVVNGSVLAKVAKETGINLLTDATFSEDVRRFFELIYRNFRVGLEIDYQAEAAKVGKKIGDTTGSNVAGEVTEALTRAGAMILVFCQWFSLYRPIAYAYTAGAEKLKEKGIVDITGDPEYMKGAVSVDRLSKAELHVLAKLVTEMAKEVVSVDRIIAPERKAIEDATPQVPILDENQRKPENQAGSQTAQPETARASGYTGPVDPNKVIIYETNSDGDVQKGPDGNPIKKAA